MIGVPYRTHESAKAAARTAAELMMMIRQLPFLISLDAPAAAAED